MADAYTFELVSPERLLVSEQVESVVIPGSEGEMTVLANHAPTMTTIKPGVVVVKTVAGREDRYVVFGGFADILPTGCTLLAESAMPAGDLRREYLETRIAAAREEVGTTSNDHARTKAEEFLAHLTTLGGVVIPA